MDGFKKILCAVDFSEGSARALGYATALAAQDGGSVTVVRVLPETDPVLDDAAASEHGRAELNRFVTRVVGTRLKQADLRTLQGDAVRRIVETAAVLPADIIVMGPHAEPRPERLPLGSVTQAVLTAAATPVAVVSAFAGRPGAPVVHVLCPIDFLARDVSDARIMRQPWETNAHALLTLQHVMDCNKEAGASTLRNQTRIGER